MREIKSSTCGWLYPLIGGLLGVAYYLLDEGVLDHLPPGESPMVSFVHGIVDGVLPVVCGVSIGLGICLVQRQAKLVKRLSVKNEVLQNDLLFHTLVSQMLHEIRNPVHTILAALENPDALSPNEQKELILRNLGRFGELKQLYEEKETLFDRLDARTPTRLDEWLPDFVADKIRSRARELDIQLTVSAPALQAAIHPLLLEQVLLTLFSNAIEAASAAPAGSRWIRFEAVRLPGKTGLVELRMTNAGAVFPEEALVSQGNRPVKSEKGHGLGLLLAKKILDHAGATLELRNRDGIAEAVIRLPGKPA